MTPLHKRVALLAVVVLVALAAAAAYWHVSRPRRLAASKDPAERLEAVRLLEESGSAGARQLLVRLAGDPAPEVAAAAVRAIGSDASPEAAAILEGLWRNASHPTIRAVALSELGRPGGMPLDVLTDVLRGDTDQAMRSAAAKALGRRGDWAALPALLAGLDDPEMAVRIRSIEAVKQITGKTFEGYSPGFNVSPAERREAIGDIAQQLGVQVGPS